MGIFSAHSTDSQDALLRPAFPLQDKLKRLSWTLGWAVLCRFTPRPLHGWRCLVLRGFGAKLGKNNFIYPNAKIWAPWLLETEDVVTLAADTEIYNPGGIKIGHHSIISQGAYICGATHDYNSPDFTYLKKPIVMEPYTWICARAVVLPGVHCGEGSVLGAAAVAKRRLDAWTVYAGNPAKAVAKRNPAAGNPGENRTMSKGEGSE
jgi:putative colanic acid biosynthesis acetyltransferase WcaF